MSVVYSLYDALVSIKVPDEKAKAVIDAMEREMMDKPATKADFEHLRLEIDNLRTSTKADIDNLRTATKADIDNLRTATKADLEHLRDVLSGDIRTVETGIVHVREILSKDIAGLSREIADTEKRLVGVMDTKLAELRHSLTVQLGSMMAAMIGLAIAILGTMQYLH